SSRRRHTRLQGDWSSDVCSSDLNLRRGKDYFWNRPPFYRDEYELGMPRVCQAHEQCKNSWRELTPDPPQAVLIGDGIVLGIGVKIGRASCRERVWGVVWYV